MRGAFIRCLWWRIRLSISQVSTAYTMAFLSGMFISLFPGARLRKMFKTRTEVMLGSVLWRR
jgi:hypothetical protein